MMGMCDKTYPLPMLARSDPILTVAESSAPSCAAQKIDSALLHRRLDQLHRAMGIQNTSADAAGPSADRPGTQRGRPPVDVLAALKAQPVAQARPTNTRKYAWVALPFIGLLTWWWTQSLAPSPPVDASPVAPAPVQRSSTPPTPAATPVDAPAAVAVPAVPETIRAAQEEAVRQRIDSWRQAWANRDVEAYLAHYGAQFKPLKEATRADWVANRRRIIGSRPDISLSLSQMQLQRMDDQRWQASFLQDYASGGYVEKQQPKTLELVQEDGQWFIVAERQTP
jgi:hypothetical protein